MFCLLIDRFALTVVHFLTGHPLSRLLYVTVLCLFQDALAEAVI